MSLLNKKPPDLPDVPEEQRTPLVDKLIEITSFQKEQLQLQKEIIQGLKDEIARLKGEKPKPKIKPSNLENKSNDKKKNDQGKKNSQRPGSKKKRKKLKIHKTTVVPPDHIPEGSRFKGYDDYLVQDLLIQPHNVDALVKTRFSG
jgi:hypothetical protein